MPPGAQSPVLIIGTERSGSNLLRLMLNAHPRIVIPHPPHFMRYLGPCATTYGDLADPRNRMRLVRDALLLQRHHLHPWEYEIDPGAVVARSHPSLFGVVAAIYDEYRRAAGKPRWGCKSTFMVDHVDDARAVFPRARFIWLVRDPRDVAGSAKFSIFGHCHPVLTARLWNRQQGRAQEALRAHGPAAVHLVRYEDLVSGPEIVLKALCHFLDEDFHPAMLAPHRTPAAVRISALSQSWRNNGCPVNTASVGSHARRLTGREQAWVADLTRGMAAGLGYELPPASPAPVPSGLALRTVDAVQRLRVEASSARHDRNYRQRKARDTVVCLITARAWIRARRRRWRRAVPSTPEESCCPPPTKT